MPAIFPIDSLLPPAAPTPSIFDSLPKANDPISSFLTDIQRIKDIYLQFTYGKVALFKNEQEIESDIDYGRYLQFPNNQVRSLADSIVNRYDSDDQKAYKLLMWVEQNITYKDDVKNYGQDEYWALPTMTLNRKSGDCEDGAFLLGSLMLNAGVNPSRLRVYGGFVSAGTNASTGGHAWVAYKREIDNQWVPLDWCYYPNEKPINDRIDLRDDTKYVDDYFYVTAFATVDASFMNTLRIQNAQAAYTKAPEPKPLVDLFV